MKTIFSRLSSALLPVVVSAVYAGGAAAGPRVASINLCADQLLMALAGPEQIVSLGPFSRDPALSFGAKTAEAVRRNAGSAETVLNGNPDLIIVGSFDSAQTRRLLATSGKPLITLPPWAGFEAGSRDIRMLAKALRREEAGEALISAIEAARQRATGAAKHGKRALVLGRGGYVDVSASLVNDLIETVGLVDAGRATAKPSLLPSTGHFLSLERIVTLKPDILVLGAASLAGQDRKAQVFAHPAFAKAYPEHAPDAPKRIVLPERLTACGGPSLIEALDTLSSALR